MKTIATIVGIISYFVLTWIVKDIWYSMAKIDAKPYEVELYSATIATILSALIAQLIRYDFNTNRIDIAPIMGGIVLFLITYGIIFLPISMGLAILFNIINIAFIVYFAVFYEE
ncbi:hypothetical protein [Dysgonomonas sp. HGC4]|uniref:hypothetical protein n=1 Tax=Dysgonomonas sp. HGC4 TaxID=1658009 RepID=UPI00067FC675|nr:hypothetical protein [Dysgonomonas sp. HGC4]MBD8348791.1 hypothetical protein [Dysgonomonas sp. HGC4]